jgi:predicted kinase
VLIVISGLPGTGKSTVGDALSARIGAVRVSVDTIEDALLGAGLLPSWELGVAAYEAARAVSEQLLAAGSIVVADAVNDSEAARSTWRTAATRAQVDLTFVVLVLEDLDEHRGRLEGRRRSLAHVPGPSWEDVRSRAVTWDPWPEGSCLLVDASAPLDQVAAALADRLGHR